MAGRRGGRVKGGVGCVGGGGERKEGGRARGMEEERATDSMEPQNSHKQSLFSGLVRHFRRIGKSFEFCLSCRHRNNFEV